MEEARTAFCRWKSGTTPRHKKAFNRAASKLNTRLRCCMQHHINCQTSKNSASPLNQHLSILAKIRGNTRNGYIPGEVDAMEQNTLKNHNALFWINPFAWPREHTHTKKRTTYPIFQTHERNDDNNNNDPFEKQVAKLHTTRFLLYLPPIKCTEPEPTETRTAQNNPKNHSKTRTNSNSQKQTTNPYHNTTCN